MTRAYERHTLEFEAKVQACMDRQKAALNSENPGDAYFVNEELDLRDSFAHYAPGDRAQVFSMLTEEEHKNKSMDRAWLEHLYDNDGEELRMNSVHILEELRWKAPSLFKRFYKKRSNESFEASHERRTRFVAYLMRELPKEITKKTKRHGNVVVFTVRRPARTPVVPHLWKKIA